MVGIIQISVAMFRLGDLTRYISDSVVRGFMAGAGCLVALSQVGNLLGLRDKGTGHHHLLYRLWLTATTGGPVNYRALAIGVGTVLVVLVGRRLARRYKLPRLDMLAALILAALVTSLLGWSHAGRRRKIDRGRRRTRAGRLAGLSRAARFKPEWIREMAGSAVAIAFLGLLEALAIAQSIAGKTRQPLGLQQAMPGRRAGQLGGRFLPVLARLGIADALVDQLSGRRRDQVVRRLFGGDRGAGGHRAGAAGPLHSQSRLGAACCW